MTPGIHCGASLSIRGHSVSCLSLEVGEGHIEPIAYTSFVFALPLTPHIHTNTGALILSRKWKGNKLWYFLCRWYNLIPEVVFIHLITCALKLSSSEIFILQISLNLMGFFGLFFVNLIMCCTAQERYSWVWPLWLRCLTASVWSACDQRDEHRTPLRHIVCVKGQNSLQHVAHCSYQEKGFWRVLTLMEFMLRSKCV